MTRAYQVVTKSVQKKSSSPFDLSYSPTKNNDVILPLKLPLVSSTSPSTICLSGLFSDLNLSKSSMKKRTWSQMYARSQRCVHLVSLLEQQTIPENRKKPALSSPSYTDTATASTITHTNDKNTRRALESIAMNQISFPTTSKTEDKNLNPIIITNTKLSFPFMTKVDIDTDAPRRTHNTITANNSTTSSSSSWGFFVEADDDDTNFYHHQQKRFCK